MKCSVMLETAIVLNLNTGNYMSNSVQEHPIKKLQQNITHLLIAIVFWMAVLLLELKVCGLQDIHIQTDRLEFR